MRIAVAIRGSRGDVLPVFAFGARLMDAGHRVVLLGNDTWEAIATRQGFGYVSLDTSPRGGSLEVQARDRFERHLSQVLPVARESDRIVSVGTSFVAPTAAEAAGIRYRYVTLDPQALPSRWHPPGCEHPFDLTPDENWSLWQQEREDNAWHMRFMDAARARLGLPPVEDPWAHFLDWDGAPVVASDPLLGPVPPDLRDRVRSVGAVQPILSGGLSEDVRKFTDEFSAVYVSFGVMPAQADAGIIEEVLQRAGLTAIVSGGSFSGRPVPNGWLATGPQPYAQLLPRVSAVVHHGGAGTTLTAARSGTPQLVLWHLGDQRYWGERVHTLGLGGAPLAACGLTSGPLSKSLRETCSPQTRARAATIRDQLDEDDNGRALARELASPS